MMLYDIIHYDTTQCDTTGYDNQKAIQKPFFIIHRYKKALENETNQNEAHIFTPGHSTVNTHSILMCIVLLHLLKT